MCVYVKGAACQLFTIYGINPKDAKKMTGNLHRDNEFVKLVPVRIDNSDVQDCDDGAQRVVDTLCKTHNYHNKGKIGGVFEGTIKVQQWMTDKTGHFLLVPNALHHVSIYPKSFPFFVRDSVIELTYFIFRAISQHFIFNFWNKRNIPSNKPIQCTISNLFEIFKARPFTKLKIKPPKNNGKKEAKKKG
ncbi:hypothetical protein RFI_23242 [Reticulomyxa filosa]|uniref:Uncharacterized protein n=1 Tax=Reticulomyxa filosa TaxID=46433 RepID=X6MJT0_RETFI|nr:hypothetical protein RFI_23242 [Reticulomyxa filosa]|eukprot:ETO14124.1 hypothetical protein RFI_23242 [Reticulomyxa filosa]